MPRSSADNLPVRSCAALRSPRSVVATLGAVLALVVVGGGGLAIVATTSSPTPWQLLSMAGRSGASTVGTVTALDVSNHNTCSYTYRVDDQSYAASESCTASSVGQTLTVHYLRANPNIQTSDDPTRHAVNLLLLPLVAGLFAAVIIAVLVIQASRFSAA